MGDVLTAQDLAMLANMKAHGFVALVAGVLYVAIKVLRLPLIQGALARLSPLAVWANWPKWVCALVVFGVSVCGLLIEGFTAGQAWGLVAVVALLVKAGVAAIGAMGGDALYGAMIAKPKAFADEKTPVNP